MKVISKNDKPVTLTKDSLRDFCKSSKSYKINKEQQDWLKTHTDIIFSLHNEFLNDDLDTVAASRIEALSVKYLGENDPLVDGANFG
jgi:hypothetical protein|tara:strand:- start:2319 stop:2579 length:261 start_codon:yes stop_codon:yes gene_type:complete